MCVNIEYNYCAHLFYEVLKYCNVFFVCIVCKRVFDVVSNHMFCVVSKIFHYVSYDI